VSTDGPPEKVFYRCDELGEANSVLAITLDKAVKRVLPRRDRLWVVIGSVHHYHQCIQVSVQERVARCRRGSPAAPFLSF
jgi:hypothetical protein